MSWGEVYGQKPPRLRAAVRPPVLALLGRFPRHPRRLHARARHRLLRELAAAPRYAQRAYAVANPLGWRGYGADCWGLTACDGPADVRLTYRRQHAALPQLRRTRRRRRAHARRRHHRRRPRPASSLPFAPELVIPAIATMREAVRREPVLEVRLPRCLQPELRRSRCRCSTARWCRASAGSTPTISASTKGRSSRCSRTIADDLVWKTMRTNAHCGAA